MEKNNKLKIMSMSFQGSIILKDNLSNDFISNLIDNSKEICWEFINEIGRAGCERPPRLIGKLTEEKSPTIIIYPSGKFQIFGSKSKKKAELICEIAFKEIKNSINLKGGLKKHESKENKRKFG